MMKERAADWAPSDSLLDLVVEQYQQDDRDGDVTAFYDMLDRLPREVLIAYLSNSRQQDAILTGVITEEEVSND